MNLIKSILKALLPLSVVRSLKDFQADRKSRHINRLSEMTFPEFKSFLIRPLQIRKGDSLFIHSGFTNLKIKETPQAIIELLMELVGPVGNLLMPFYPLKSSYEFLAEGKPFDLREPWTSMGALPLVFGAMDGVKKSIHPTKSVAVWGKDRDFLIKDHHRSPLPFGPESPYGRLIQLPQSKIVGLGVNADFLSCMHVAVDSMDDYPIQPYHPHLLQGTVVDYDGSEVSVKTFAHNLEINAHENIPRFLAETRCPTFIDFTFKGRSFYVVEAQPLIAHTINEAKKGSTFFYPRSLNFKQPRRDIKNTL